MLAVDSDHIAHVLDSPDIHVDYSLIFDVSAKQILSSKAIDDIDAHWHRLCNNEGALAEIGKARERPVSDFLTGAESLPFCKSEEFILVLNTQIFAEEATDLRLTSEIIVSDDNAILVLDLLVLRDRRREVQALFHFLVGNVMYY